MNVGDGFLLINLTQENLSPFFSYTYMYIVILYCCLMNVIKFALNVKDKF